MLRHILTALVFLGAFPTLQAQCVQGDCSTGYGAYVYSNGARYDGQFRNGRPHGQGRFQFADGNKYVGHLENGYRQGGGKFTFKEGHEYIGGFLKNKFHGQGKTTFVNGDVHDGQYRNHQPHGAGIYHYADGNRYEGNFENGKFNGTGTMFYTDGTRYEGNWADNKKHGRGSLILANGKVQTGEWAYGKLNGSSGSTGSTSSGGSGTASTSTTRPTRPSVPSKIRDCNSEHCASGQGQYAYGDGSRYVGEFTDGRPEGRGILYYANGNRYEGYWANHSPEGEGVMYYNNGRVLGGVWERGKFIREVYADQGSAAAIKVEVDRDPAVKVWAVIVGVGRYEHMRSLRFTDDDAYQFYAHLRSPEGGAVPSDQLRVLIDEEATRLNVLKALRQTLLRADANDVIMFYFSGHGLAGSFLPVDYNGYENRLMHEDIKQVLEDSKAKHKIVIADACYSGSLMAARTPFQDLEDRFTNQWNQSKGGLALLMSSKEEEVSLEDGGLRSGVFSYYLIKGLNGEADTDADKTVTIKELYTYVNREVRSYTNRAQNPTITGNYDKAMPVALLR